MRASMERSAKGRFALLAAEIRRYLKIIRRATSCESSLFWGFALSIRGAFAQV
jgi:hypothetical protein